METFPWYVEWNSKYLPDCCPNYSGRKMQTVTAHRSTALNLSGCVTALCETEIQNNHLSDKNMKQEQFIG